MAFDDHTYNPMNHIPSIPPSQPANGMAPQTQNRNGYNPQKENGVPVPGTGGYYRNGPASTGMMPGPPLFDLARSPPGSGPNKNTKHVPCKFFRQGNCQAGSACPFSHSLDPMTHQAPCKYFMKGNCKFGAKCALAHYLPDGRRVNQRDLESGMNQMAQQMGMPFGRSQSMAYPNSDAPVTDRLPPQPAFPSDYFPTPGFPFGDLEEQDAFQDRYNQYQPTSNLDSAINSPPTSQFGSPPTEAPFPKSPAENLRTALNAPLPQSFDASGMSRIAQYGPLGQSVPDKFGMRSPPGSSLSRQLASPPEVGGFRGSTLGSNLRNTSPLAVSPQNNEESIGQRIMHSQKQTKPRMISASVPRSSLYPDWEEGLGGEADLLPNSLHDEVLTPQEKMRRLSRPDQDLGSGMAIPSGTSSKVGSPPVAGSPSRFSALWAEQREKKAAETTASGLGHVGSPLRESWMPSESTASSGVPRISGISQAMAQLHLTKSEDPSSSRPPLAGFRHSSNPVGRFDRTISSPGLSAKRIDEEVEGAFFPMDDDKRASSIWSGASPRLAPLRERANGEASRSKKDEGSLGVGNGVGSLYGFQP